MHSIGQELEQYPARMYLIVSASQQRLSDFRVDRGRTFEDLRVVHQQQLHEHNFM